MEFRIKEYDEVSSTNDVVKEAIDTGQPEGLAVVARTQTAGYGRRGNRWASGPGSLYMSILLRPGKSAAELQTLSLVTAIAVRRALSSFFPEGRCDDVRIKWPNDVVAMSKGEDRARFNKVCGISVEARDGAVCVGVGVNVSNAEGGAPDEVEGARNRPTFLCELVPERGCPTVAKVRDELLVQFSEVYETWLQLSFEAFREEFMRHFALEGFKIRIDDAGDARPVRCEVVGITSEGRLLVRPDGEEGLREIASGTVTVVG